MYRMQDIQTQFENDMHNYYNPPHPKKFLGVNLFHHGCVCLSAHLSVCGKMISGQ